MSCYHALTSVPVIHFCYIFTGEYIQNRMLFPVDFQNPPEERTKESYWQHLESIRRGEEGYGVLGETPLAHVLQIPDDVAIDYMHSVIRV